MKRLTLLTLAHRPRPAISLGLPKHVFSSSWPIWELKQARLDDLRHRLGQVWRISPPEAWQSLERVDHALAKTRHLVHIERMHNAHCPDSELGAIVKQLDAVVERLETRPSVPMGATECLEITKLIDRIDLLEDQ